MLLSVGISLKASKGNKWWYDLAKCGADTNVRPVMYKIFLVTFSIEFNEEYRAKSNPNLSHVYNKILISILNILPNINQSKEVKENLEDHINYLLDI